MINSIKYKRNISMTLSFNGIYVILLLLVYQCKTKKMHSNDIKTCRNDSLRFVESAPYIFTPLLYNITCSTDKYEVLHN